MDTNFTATPNSSFWSQYDVHSTAPLWMRLSALVISTISIIVGSVGNFTALIAFVTSRSLRQFSNINLFLLTVNDLIVSLFVCPHFIVKYWLGWWPLSQAYCNWYTLFHGGAYVSSLILVALIAYERYLMVKLGALYRQQQSWKTVLSRSVPLAICLPYTMVSFGCFTDFYQRVMQGSAVPESVTRTKCLPQVNLNGYLFALVSWAQDILPLAVMMFCYVSVFSHRKAWKLSHQQQSAAIVHVVRTEATAFNSVVPAPPTATVNSTTKTHNDYRAARLLNVMFAAVLITQIPYMVMSFAVSLVMIGAAPGWDPVYWVSLYELASVLTMLNNAVNPLLYAYTMPDFDRAARNVWRILGKKSIIFSRWIT